MMLRLFVLSVLTASAFAQCGPPPAAKPAATPSAPVKDAAAAPMQMMTYQMVLFREAHRDAAPKQPGAEQKPQPTSKLKNRGHLENLARLNRERINVAYGPFTGDDPTAPSMKGLAGVAILDVPDAATAKQHFAADPYVQAGDMVLEVKPWLGPKGWFHEPSVPASGDPEKMVVEPLVFGVLVRGPAAKTTPPVHTQIGRAHV